MLAGCCQQLRNSCTAMMKICWHLQSEHTVWVDRVQSEQGGVCAVGTLESKHCLEAFGEKKKTWHCWADFYGLFFSPSLEKGRICFCARWKERTFSVPEEFSGNFWFLQCLIALWSPVLGEVQPFLPPGSLQSWGFTCWEFLFPFKDKHLNWQIFPLSTFFREFVMRARKVQSKKYYS